MAEPKFVSTDFFAEPLTRREKEVLGMIAEHLSDREIADRLTLSINSVKWYARQIYEKLDVDNRHKAVERARSLGILGGQDPRKLVSHPWPRQITRFIGRKREIQQVTELVWKQPLVTLIGSGGVGKTRLALAVADEFLAYFPGGIYYVDLATLTNPQLVPRAVMEAIGLREEPGRAIEESLIYYFSGSQAVLILDNCEHLVDACASLVDTLLRAAPELKVLASSREPLRVPGEVVFRVPSLLFPPSGQLKSVEELLEYDSIQLYLDRAQAALPEFHLDAQNAAAVAKICQRLDGIPLALELAASRTASLGVAEIAARLDQAFRLLTGGGRTTLERQRTLRSAIDWSYQLISEPERILLRRLGIFMGGWTLEAAEMVCPGNDISKDEVLNLLSLLVDKSLVLADHASGQETRYRMLETIRQFALEELYRSGESEELHKRHCDWFICLAEEAGPNLYKSMGQIWFEKLKNDHDNLRAALEWSLGEGSNTEGGLRLLNAVTELYWYTLGSPGEAYHWLEQGFNAITGNTPGSVALKVRTLINMQILSCGITQSDSIGLLEQSVELLKYLGPEDKFLRARTLGKLGIELANQLGELQRGLQLVNEAEMILREINEEESWDFAMILNFKAIICRFLGDEDGFQYYCTRSASLFLKLGDTTGNSYYMLAEAAQRRKDYETTKKYCEMGLQRTLEINGQFDVAYYYRKVADWMRMLGRNDDAVQYYNLSLKVYDSLALLTGCRFTLGGLASSHIALAQDQNGDKARKILVWTARILGAIKAAQDRTNLVTFFEDRMIYDQALSAVKKELEPAIFQAAWDEGTLMKERQAIDYALRGVGA